MKRDRSSIYEPIREKLIEYIELRARLYQHDKSGLSHCLLQEKAEKYAAQLGLGDKFKASKGFISRALKRANKVSVALHGEAMEMNSEEKQKKLREFHQRLCDLIEKHDVGVNRIYNTDQTGLYYNKMPNRIYIDKDQKKNFRGVKLMKSKDRVTLMVCTAASGDKIPLFMAGKSAHPACFKLFDGPPSMAYTHQNNAWFDRTVTAEWISRVFWPNHFRKHGDKVAILLLDNFSAHKFLDASFLPKKLLIEFFPANCTSFMQPADMGMIACLKVGYKANMLKKLLAICDDPQLLEDVVRRSSKIKRGCKGLD
ncbi:MAG: hypothetical protein ACREOZ_00470, partial [Gloeomargaritales cyanobacterium]